MSVEKTKEELDREAAEKRAEDDLASHAQVVEEGSPTTSPASASSPDIIRRDQHDRETSKQ